MGQGNADLCQNTSLLSEKQGLDLDTGRNYGEICMHVPHTHDISKLLFRKQFHVRASMRSVPAASADI